MFKIILLAFIYCNMPYTKKQKQAYAIKMAKMQQKPKMVGRGAYYANSYQPMGRSYIQGRGAYKVNKQFFSAPQVGRSLGGASGGIIGNMIAPGIGGAIGSSIGSGLGEALGMGFKKLTGWGSYEVKSNSLIYPDRIVPSFGDDSIRVRKREYICDINATTAFTNNVFPVNPGLSEVFPWLSAIANNYEQYRFNGLVFQFVSTSSEAIASTTDLGLGQVILASDYNAADSAYVNSPQMLSTMFANSGRPSDDILHAVECAPTDQAQKLYYVRSGDAPSNTDIRLYDMLNFQLATDKMPANYNGCGQLWVTYDVTFCKSIQNNQLGLNINTDKYILTACQLGSPLGTSRSLVSGSNLGTTLAADSITFPPELSSGYYLILYEAAGASTLNVAEPSLVLTNCTIMSTWLNNTDDTVTNGTSTATRIIQGIIVRIDDRDATIAYQTGVYPTSPTYGDLLITQINGDLFV